MILLSKGGNAGVPGDELVVRVRWSPESGGPAVDASALLIGASGKVGSDADFVFYNQPTAAAGAVRHLGGEGAEERLAVRPGALPAEVDRVVVAASLDRGTFGAVSGLELVVEARGEAIVQYPVDGAAGETVLVLGELYRRADQWKVRAIGQGYDTGLAGLATDYGVTVDDSPEPTPAAAPPPVSAAPAMASGPAAEDSLPPEMRERISLRKKAVGVVLEKKGIADVRAGVGIVLDASGSMIFLYRDGTVGRVVERMAPIAARLDEDGSLDAWIFADRAARLPALTVAELPTWVPEQVRMRTGGGSRRFRRRANVDPDALGYGNNEPEVMKDIIEFYRSQPTGRPSLVLFFSDGGVYENEKIAALLREASGLPIFWQFVGLGDADYGILEDLDTLPGRVVDNAGFFAVDDIDQVSDEELYNRLLGEFPQWLRAARAAGILS